MIKKKKMNKAFLTILAALAIQAQSMLPYTPGCDQVVKHGGYTLCYSEKYEQAKWVAYELTVKNLLCDGKRKNSFRIDTDIVTGSATVVDYYRSGYDRGHLAPAADFKCDMRPTFLMSNISPQKPMFNRGVWKRLERWARDKAKEDGLVYVITGPVLHDSLKTIGINEVAVPEQFYKIVFNDWRVTAFLIPNKWAIGKLDKFVVSVDSVESVTGIDFFSELPDSIEKIIEQSSYYE